MREPFKDLTRQQVEVGGSRAARCRLCGTQKAPLCAEATKTACCAYRRERKLLLVANDTVSSDRRTGASSGGPRAGSEGKYLPCQSLKASPEEGPWSLSSGPGPGTDRRGCGMEAAGSAFFVSDWRNFWQCLQQACSFLSDLHGLFELLLLGLVALGAPVP